MLDPSTCITIADRAEVCLCGDPGTKIQVNKKLKSDCCIISMQSAVSMVTAETS